MKNKLIIRISNILQCTCMLQSKNFIVDFTKNTGSIIVASHSLQKNSSRKETRYVHHVALQIASYLPTLINTTDSITRAYDPVTIDLFLVQGYVRTRLLTGGCVPYPRSTQISLALRRSHEDFALLTAGGY